MNALDLADMLENHLVHDQDLHKKTEFPIDFKNNFKTLAARFAGAKTSPETVTQAVDIVMQEISDKWESRHNFLLKLQA